MKNPNKNKYISLENYSLFFKSCLPSLCLPAVFSSCGFGCNVTVVPTNKIMWIFGRRFLDQKWWGTGCRILETVTGVRLCIKGWRLNFMFPLFIPCSFILPSWAYSTIHTLAMKINYLKHVVCLSYYLLFDKTRCCFRQRCERNEGQLNKKNMFIDMVIFIS